MGHASEKRRQWKLATLKTFCIVEPVSIILVSKNIGEDVLDELLNQCFLVHPGDPILGARHLQETLLERFGDKYRRPIPRRRRVKPASSRAKVKPQTISSSKAHPDS